MSCHHDKPQEKVTAHLAHMCCLVIRQGVGVMPWQGCVSPHPGPHPLQKMIPCQSPAPGLAEPEPVPGVAAALCLGQAAVMQLAQGGWCLWGGGQGCWKRLGLGWRTGSRWAEGTPLMQKGSSRGRPTVRSQGPGGWGACLCLLPLGPCQGRGKRGHKQARGRMGKVRPSTPKEAKQ